jgi:hypothetical protein
LLIDQEERVLLQQLAQYALTHPFDVRAAVELCKTPEGLAQHKRNLDAYTVFIPTAFLVTFTIEEQPMGQVRHLSMSSKVPGRSPNPFGVWMVAQELGFWGPGIEACDHLYPEELPDNRRAINLIQLVSRPTQH